MLKFEKLDKRQGADSKPRDPFRDSLYSQVDIIVQSPILEKMCNFSCKKCLETCDAFLSHHIISTWFAIWFDLRTPYEIKVYYKIIEEEEEEEEEEEAEI